MKTNTLFAAGAISILFAGCWTVSETEYPDVEVARLPAGKATSVSFSGFEVDLQRYVPVEGHEQMKTNKDDRVDGPCVKENSATNQFYMTRNTASRKLVDRASVGMERKGFEVKTLNPQYVIDMKYAGPFDRDYDALIYLACVALAQVLEATFVLPHIGNPKTALPPVWVTVGVTIGGGVAGFVGMLVAIPIASSIRQLILFDYERRKAIDGANDTDEAKPELAERPQSVGAHARVSELPESLEETDGDGVGEVE